MVYKFNYCKIFSFQIYFSIGFSCIKDKCVKHRKLSFEVKFYLLFSVVCLVLLLKLCCWVIWKLTIKSWCSFSLQFLAFDTEASHDILRVWDGPPENEMLLKEISGSLIPEGIHSTLNIVTIQFDTDFYISKSGFAIQFSSKLINSIFNLFYKIVHSQIIVVLETLEISGNISDVFRERIGIDLKICCKAIFLS